MPLLSWPARRSTSNMEYLWGGPSTVESLLRLGPTSAVWRWSDLCMHHACMQFTFLIKFQKNTWFRKWFTLAFTLRWQLAKTIAGWQEPIVVSEWKKGDTSPSWFCVLWSISCWFQRWLEGIFTWIAGVLNTSKLILSSRDNILDWDICMHAQTLKLYNLLYFWLHYIVEDCQRQCGLYTGVILINGSSWGDNFCPCVCSRS